MSLLDQLKRGCAGGIDALKHIAEGGGADTHISIVISHPGTVEDSFYVGEHSSAELFAILARLETGEAVECDVSSTHVGPNEPQVAKAVQ